MAITLVITLLHWKSAYAPQISKEKIQIGFLEFVFAKGMKLHMRSNTKYPKVPLKWSVFPSCMACLSGEEKDGTMLFLTEFECGGNLALEERPPVLSRRDFGSDHCEGAWLRS